MYPGIGGDIWERAVESVIYIEPRFRGNRRDVSNPDMNPDVRRCGMCGPELEQDALG